MRWMMSMSPNGRGKPELGPLEVAWESYGETPTWWKMLRDLGGSAYGVLVEGDVAPISDCSRTLRRNWCEWDGARPGRKWLFLLFDVGEVF